MSEGFFDRLLLERQELAYRVTGLGQFFNKLEYRELDPCQQYLLVEQSIVMSQYLTILDTRIAHLQRQGHS